MKKRDKLNLWNKLKAHAANKFGVFTDEVNLPQYEQMMKWADQDKALKFTRDNNVYNVVFTKEDMPE